MCYERITHGELPGCVEACPYEATIFGDRDELLKLAHQRIEENPGKYVNQVFGETEVGGTSVLYISDIPLDFLAYQPELGDTPLPDRTWAALSKVPPLVVGMAGLMAGMYWITNRRNQLAEEAARESGPGSRPEGGKSSEQKEGEES
jgi:formate dehydrogenase iron-sulfur subunit